MAKVKAELLEPLDGKAVGSIVDFDEADFERLAANGSVKAAEAPANKMQPAPANKADPGAGKRKG